MHTRSIRPRIPNTPPAGRIALFILALLLAAPASPAPAAWYLWRSKADSRLFCAQVPPGDGWERLRGPFRDSRCEHPGRPGY